MTFVEGLRARSTVVRGEDPWVIVAGGFHQRGGMDKANAALAEFLIQTGREVHLVGHDVDPAFRHAPSVTVHSATRPYGALLLGAPFLRRRGRDVATSISRNHHGARVLVNGGNLPWPGINWVHFVHHAYTCFDDGAPLWFQSKNRLFGWLARRDEMCALRIARCIIANSERTKRDLVELLDIDEVLVHTVYLGCDPSPGRPTRTEREAARSALGLEVDRPIVCFVGALSYDNRKGLDLLWRAWQVLCARKSWDVNLVIAGGGNANRRWLRTVRSSGLSHRVRILGFTERIPDLLAASDLLVSPVRYEPYGLNVQEALARELPVIVSADAGIAERFPVDARAMILNDPENVDELIGLLEYWSAHPDAWREPARQLGLQLQARTWSDMAGDIVRIADETYR